MPASKRLKRSTPFDAQDTCLDYLQVEQRCPYAALNLTEKIPVSDAILCRQQEIIPCKTELPSDNESEKFV